MSTSGGYKGVPPLATYAASGVTDAAGLLTLAFPAGKFTAWPVVVATRLGASSPTQYDISIASLSNTSVTIAVRKAVPVTVLALSVLAASVVANGETIHVQAQAAG